MSNGCATLRRRVNPSISGTRWLPGTGLCLAMDTGGVARPRDRVVSPRSTRRQAPGQSLPNDNPRGLSSERTTGSSWSTRAVGGADLRLSPECPLDQGGVEHEYRLQTDGGVEFRVRGDRRPVPPRRCEGVERGAPGSGQQGAAEGEGAASGLGGVVGEDVRLRRVRLREVWRQAAGFGVRDGTRWVRAILEHLGLPTSRASLAKAQGLAQRAWC